MATFSAGVLHFVQIATATFFLLVARRSVNCFRLCSVAGDRLGVLESGAVRIWITIAHATELLYYSVLQPGHGLPLVHRSQHPSGPSANPASLTELCDIACLQVVGCVFWQVAYLSINPTYRASAMALVETASEHLKQQKRSSRTTHAALAG